MSKQKSFDKQWKCLNIKPNNIIKIKIGTDYYWLYIDQMADKNGSIVYKAHEIHELADDYTIAQASSLSKLGSEIMYHYALHYGPITSTYIQIEEVNSHIINMLNAGFEAREYYFNRKFQ
uniref:hypothetical protein n=1 Tax=Lactobacillus acidophilus TaxID=1579 RepID=UPI003F57A881